MRNEELWHVSWEQGLDLGIASLDLSLGFGHTGGGCESILGVGSVVEDRTLVSAKSDTLLQGVVERHILAGEIVADDASTESDVVGHEEVQQRDLDVGVVVVFDVILAENETLGASLGEARADGQGHHEHKEQAVHYQNSLLE